MDTHSEKINVPTASLKKVFNESLPLMRISKDVPAIVWTIISKALDNFIDILINVRDVKEKTFVYKHIIIALKDFFTEEYSNTLANKANDAGFRFDTFKNDENPKNASDTAEGKKKRIQIETKSGLNLSVSSVKKEIINKKTGKKISQSFSIGMTAVLEEILKDIFKAASKVADSNKRKTVFPQDLIDGLGEDLNLSEKLLAISEDISIPKKIKQPKEPKIKKVKTLKEKKEPEKETKEEQEPEKETEEEQEPEPEKDTKEEQEPEPEKEEEKPKEKVFDKNVIPGKNVTKNTAQKSEKVPIKEKKQKTPVNKSKKLKIEKETNQEDDFETF